MVLSISRKVDVQPGVIAPIVSANIQNCLLLSNEDRFVDHEIKEYSSLASVQEDFGATSKEANFARAYFGGFVGATKRPEKLLIGQNYSLNARSASITSSFFTAEENPQDQLKQIGSGEAQPSVVKSKEYTLANETVMNNALADIGREYPSAAYIESVLLKPSGSNLFNSMNDIFQILNNIGQDQNNFGDLTIQFNHGGNPISVTATNIDLSKTNNLEEALQTITEDINKVIEENEALGENYKVTFKCIGNDNDGFVFRVEATNTGPAYTIDQISSTVPALYRIANNLYLSPEDKPKVVPGTDYINGEFSIWFNIGESSVKVSVTEFNFTQIDEFSLKLKDLIEKINNAIGATQKLGNEYKINISEIKTPTEEPTKFTIELETLNTGANYNIINVSGNVAEILGLTRDSNAEFFPGSDKLFGNFSIEFDVNGEAIVATAENLDFTTFNTLDAQLNYLNTQINNAINVNSNLGSSFGVQISKNDLENDLYNVSITTINTGGIYKINSVSSTLPLSISTAADILKLTATSAVSPTIVDGISNLPLSLVLEKYANDRSDWWSISMTEVDIEAYNEIADWVNSRNGGCRYVFIAHDNNSEAKTTKANSNTFGYAIYQSGKKATTTIFGDESHAGFIAGVAASIDYDRVNGVLTFSARRQNGLAITVNSDKEADCLESNYYNYYGSYSSTNPKYRFFETGIVSGADNQNWLDSLFNQIWLLNEIQNAIFNLLIEKKKIPFNNTGYAMISNVCDAVALKAVSCGVISAGITLDALQLSVVTDALGKDVSSNLYNFGYYLYIGDNSASDRLKRIARNCMLFYCDGGSIQTVKFVANVIL